MFAIRPDLSYSQYVLNFLFIASCDAASADYQPRRIMHIVCFILIVLSSLSTAFPSASNHLSDTDIQRHQQQPRDDTASIYFPTDCPAINLSLAGTIAHRTPLSPPPATLHRRSTPGGFYVCTQPNWQGICHYEVLALGRCYGVTPVLDWDGSIAALGPDPGAACAIWSAPAAVRGGEALVAVWPGWSDLAGVGWGPGTDDEVMGVYCWAM